MLAIEEFALTLLYLITRPRQRRVNQTVHSRGIFRRIKALPWKFVQSVLQRPNKLRPEPSGGEQRLGSVNIAARQRQPLHNLNKLVDMLVFDCSRIQGDCLVQPDVTVGIFMEVEAAPMLYLDILL